MVEPAEIAPNDLLKLQYSSNYGNMVRTNVDTLADNPVDIQAEALSSLGLKGNETVLDLGCNDARILGQIRRNGHKGVLYGVDPSEEALAAGELLYVGEGKELDGDDRLIQGYAEDLPLPTNSVDKVFASRVLDHLEDPELAILELMRVVRLGGTVVFTTSGVENKRGTHAQAQLIAKHLGAKGTTSLTNGVTSEVALPMLQEYFPEVASFPHVSLLHLRDPSSSTLDKQRHTEHRAGQESYHSLYLHMPEGMKHLVPVSLKDWRKAYDEVAWPEMKKTMDSDGAWVDLIDRSVIVCRNPEPTRRHRPSDDSIDEILLFDNDRTLRSGYAFFGIYDAMEAEGFISASDNREVQSVFERLNDGEIEFEQFVVDSMYTGANALKGRRVAVASEITKQFLEATDAEWYGYVRPLLAEAKQAGAKLAIITAAPQFVADASGEKLGMDFRYGSQFGIALDGTFNGTVRSGNVLTSSKKAEIAERLTKHAKKSAAFGDSIGDLGMLAKVDRPYAVNPSEQLRHFAEEAGWPIIEDPSQPISFQNIFAKKTS